MSLLENRLLAALAARIRSVPTELVTSTIGFGLLIAAAGASTASTLLRAGRSPEGHRPASNRNSHAGPRRRREACRHRADVADWVYPVEIKPVEQVNSPLTAAS
jgi:hypothetical protein